MPWNKDGSRKTHLYKTSGFKMKGWSAFTKETNLPEEEQQKIAYKKSAWVDPPEIKNMVNEFNALENKENKTESEKIKMKNLKTKLDEHYQYMERE